MRRDSPSHSANTAALDLSAVECFEQLGRMSAAVRPWCSREPTRGPPSTQGQVSCVDLRSQRLAHAGRIDLPEAGPRQRSPGVPRPSTQRIAIVRRAKRLGRVQAPREWPQPKRASSSATPSIGRLLPRCARSGVTRPPSSRALMPGRATGRPPGSRQQASQLGGERR